MALLLLSFLAGILTVLSPCVFTLIPVILGGTLQTGNKKRHLTIIGSFITSIFLFTLILKASTSLINIPLDFWSVLSGLILVFIGIITIFPEIWAKISSKFSFSNKSEKFLQSSVEQSRNNNQSIINQNSGSKLLPDILTGIALGPVFSSCSPTYAIIFANILPVSFLEGTIYLIAYSLGLGIILLIISIFGRKAIDKLKWATKSDSKFKKFLGVIFIIIGILIIFKIDKQIQTASLTNEGFLNITRFEINLLDRTQ